MNGTAQQPDHSRAASALRWSLPAWKPDHRAGKKPEGDWHDLPVGFLEALKIAEPFVGRDRSKLHMMGVLLNGEHAYATDNTVLVEVELGGGAPHTMVPLWLVRLIKKRNDSPVRILVLPLSVAVEWEDGTWISAASTGELPASVVEMFDGWKPPQWQISRDWKAAFRDVSRLSKDVIIIGPNRLKGGGGQAKIEADAVTPVSGGTVWDRAVLAPVIKIADCIDFSTWPELACFSFPNGRGFVAGRR
jgi:hypothetical protein